MKMTAVLSALLVLVMAPATLAKDGAFHAGELIPEFGKIATIDSDVEIPSGTEMQVSFDVAKQAEAGSTNRNLESAARFLNMHVEAGMAPQDLKLAIVVHGGASKDLLSGAAYKKRFGVESGNAALLRALMKHGVEIILCGQSAAYHDLAKEDLEPGVKVALSAMTAHALLQQEGYTLNPF
jgi:intracellular sulfur oxidation DsrE/DsrF family protein